MGDFLMSTEATEAALVAALLLLATAIYSFRAVRSATRATELRRGKRRNTICMHLCVAAVASVGLLVLFIRILRSAIARFELSDASVDLDLAIEQALRRHDERRLPGTSRHDELVYTTRYNASGPPAWRDASDVNATFFRLMRAHRSWQPQVLRWPTASKHGHGAWMVLLRNFSSAREAQAIIDGADGSWGAATHISTGRHSDSALCNARDVRRCKNRPELARAVRTVTKRVEAAIGVSEDHFESTQLLRYLPGDYISLHHDSNPSYARITGVRMLTAFLYLSELPEGSGGETVFTQLPGSGRGRRRSPLAIAPRVGMLAVWPNVRADRPARGVPDMRMLHESRTVTRGVKYSANIWVRLQASSFL